jgi:hypothetical protein
MYLSATSTPVLWLLNRRWLTPSVVVSFKPASRLRRSNEIICNRFCCVPNLYAISVRGHSSNGNGAVRLADRRTHPLIVPCSERTHPALYQWLHGQCVIASFKPNILEEATSTQEVFDLVQDGVGTAIVPAGIYDEVPPAL